LHNDAAAVQQCSSAAVQQCNSAAAAYASLLKR